METLKLKMQVGNRKHFLNTPARHLEIHQVSFWNDAELTKCQLALQNDYQKVSRNLGKELLTAIIWQSASHTGSKWQNELFSSHSELAYVN